MKYLIILFSLITFSIFGQSGIEPTSLQGTPYQGGILVGITPIIDEFTGDTIYLYQHSDTSFVKIDSLVYTDSLRLYTSQGVFTTYVSGGGGLSGSGVATRVAFWSGTNSLSSNSNLYWDNVNNRLGIGNSAPNYELDVTGRQFMQQGTWNVFVNGGNTTLSGTGNVGIGSNLTLASNTTGSNNVSLGNASGNSNTTGSNNFYLGNQAGFSNVSSSDNVFIGSLSGYLTTGSDNTYIGSGSGSNSTTGTANVSVGSLSGYSGGTSNTNLGFYSGFGNTGQFNVNIGRTSGQNSGTGIYNVYIGGQAGQNNTGSENVCIGLNSGATGDGSNNVFLGSRSGQNETGSNKLYIENSNSDIPLIGGYFDINRVGINTHKDSISRTLDVNGEVRVRDLTTTTPTKIMANDNDGVLSSVGLGTGINISGGNIVNTGVITEVDGSITNEIQQIQKSGSNDVNIQITGGAGVGIESTLTNVLVPSNGSNGQILIKGSGTNYGWGDEIGDISNVTVSAPIVGGGVSGGVNIAIDTTSSTGVATQYDLTQIDQLQTISTSGTAGNITLSDGGGTLNLNVNDADSDPANEYNTAVTVVHEVGNARPRVKVTDNGSTLGGLIPFFETTSLNAGVVVGSNGASNSNFLRADGNWAIPTLSEVDGSVTNEGVLGVSAGSGTTSIITSNTSTATGVTITAGTNMTISETTSTNGGNITLNASLTEVDGSITNEGYQGVTAGSATSSVIQGYNSSGNPTGTGTTINAVGSISISETTSTNGGQITLTGDYGAFAFGVVGNTTVINVDGSGTAQIQAGTNITATNSGGIVTISSTAGATNLGVSGTGTIALTSSTGADVSIASGTNISLTSTGTTMTVNTDISYGYMSGSPSSISTSPLTLYKINVNNPISNGVVTASAANDRFTVSQTGTYEIHYDMDVNYDWATNKTLQVTVRKNISSTEVSGLRTTSTPSSSTMEYGVSKTALVQLSSGDYVELFITIANASSTFNYQNVNFSIKLID